MPAQYADSLFEEGTSFSYAINGIKFTPRELEIISCLLSWRTAKRIAAFLSISPKTVENHLHHIMQKLGCNSRESIIEVIERSEGIAELRDYAARLMVRLTLHQKLHKVAKTQESRSFPLLIIAGPHLQKTPFLKHLTQDLETANLSVSYGVEYENLTSEALMSDSLKRTEDILLYVISPTTAQTLHSLKSMGLTVHQDGNPHAVVCLLVDKRSGVKKVISFPSTPDLTLENARHYASSCGGLLETLFPFLGEENSYHFGSIASDLEGNRENAQNNSLKKKGLFEGNLKEILKNLFRYKKVPFIGGIIGGLLLLGAPVFLFFRQSSQTFTHVNLSISHKEVLLERSDLLSEIEQKFKGDDNVRAIALVGLNGCGKKTLARQYAYAHPAEITWEIDGATEETLLHSFETLAFVLAQTPEDKQNLKEIERIRDCQEYAEKLVFFTREKLKFYSHWLLLYYLSPNVAKGFQKYFPQEKGWGKGQVIVVTTDDNIQNNTQIDHVVHVNELTEPQKLALFLNVLKRNDPRPVTTAQLNYIKDFLRQIPSFPLDVSLAAVYIKETRIPYENYLKYLHSHRSDFNQLQQNVFKEITGGDQRTRDGIIDLTLKKLILKNPKYADLLLCISVIKNQYIPRELLYCYKDPLLVDAFIHDLKTYSLTQFMYYDLDQSIPTFSIHSSVPENILNYLKDTRTHKALFDEIGAALESHISQIIENKDLLRIKLALQHAHQFLHHSSFLSQNTQGRLSIKIGTMYEILGNYALSQQWLKEGLGILDSVGNKDISARAYGLCRLGNICRYLGDYQNAKQLLEKSLHLYKENLVNDHKGLAAALRYLGLVYSNVGDYAKAQEKLREALEIIRIHLEQDPLKTAHILAYLGNIERELGNLKQAKDLLLQAQKLNTQSVAPNYLRMNQTNMYLANVYHDLGELKKALPVFEKGLIHYEKTFGKNNIKLCSVLRRFGNLQRSLGEFEKGKELLERSLKIYRAHFPETHIDIAHSEICLGLIYRDLGDYQNARKLLTKVYATYKAHYGIAHFETARVLRDLGYVYYLQGDLLKGKELMEDSLAIFKATGHPEISTVYGKLAELSLKECSKASDNRDPLKADVFKKQAIIYLRNALAVMGKHLPKDSVHITEVENKLKNLESV